MKQDLFYKVLFRFDTIFIHYFFLILVYKASNKSEKAWYLLICQRKSQQCWFKEKCVPCIFQTIKAVLPDMIESNRGHLVSISSVLGLLGMRGVSDYCSSKFAISGLMEALQWELQEYSNIHITAVHPYLVDNQMFAGLKLR